VHNRSAHDNHTIDALLNDLATNKAEVADMAAADAIIRYNDWIGWPGHALSPAGVAATAKVISAWNAMLCAAAERRVQVRRHLHQVQWRQRDPAIR
jgi:hypothetical protein